MVKLGIVEQRERYSRTAINNIKKFWSLTAKGCMFGKNITSPANPRETQPHFFESRFFVLPLCRKHHDELHADTVAFEEKYGSQLELIFRFIDRALAIGVLA